MNSILYTLRPALIVMAWAGICLTQLWAADEQAGAKPTDDAATTAATTTAPSSLPSGLGDAADPRKIVAKVNGETVTQGEVDEQAQMMLQQRMQRMAMMGQPPPGDQLEKLHQEVASQAVVETVRQKLVDQAVVKELPGVSDAQLNEHIEQVRKLFKSQNRDFEELLNKQGKTIETIKPEIRKQLAFYKLVEREEDVKQPTEAEIKELYEQHKNEMQVPERVRASHILLGYGAKPGDPNYKPPTDAEKAEKKKQAGEILARAKKGEDFAKLAQENSSDPGSKADGGDLNFFGRGMMTKNFEDAAFLAHPGEITGPVETEFGYHIIKVTDHNNTKTMTFDDMKFQMHQKLRSDRVREKMPDLVAKLQKKAKIELMDGSKMPDPEAPPAGPMALPQQKPDTLH